MKPTSLADLYAKFTPVAGEAPADVQRELDQRDVFSLGSRPPLFQSRWELDAD